MDKKTIEELIEYVETCKVRLHEEAVLACDPVALDDDRDFSRQLDDLRHPTRQGSDGDDDRNVIAERAGLQLGAIVGDYAGLLRPLDALAHRRCRHLDASRKLREREPRLGDEIIEERDIHRIGEKTGASRTLIKRLRSNRTNTSYTFDRAWQNLARPRTITAVGHSKHSAATGPVGHGTALVDRVPPHGYFVVSAIFHYLGPSFAVLLFAVIDPVGVAWLRIVSAADVFAAWRHPWRFWAGLTRHDRGAVLALGAVLAAMNISFYLAIARLPLTRHRRRDRVPRKSAEMLVRLLGALQQCRHVVRPR